MTDVERVEVDDEQEDPEHSEVRYAFCEPVYRVAPSAAATVDLVRWEWVAGVDYVAAWRAALEAASR